MTLRRLAQRAESRQVEHWAHTSALLAMIANCRSGRKRGSRTVRPRELNPMPGRHRARRGPFTKEDLTDLKAQLSKGARRKR